jgi:hypothetical protein
MYTALQNSFSTQFERVSCLRESSDNGLKKEGRHTGDAPAPDERMGIDRVQFLHVVFVRMI